MKPLFTIATVTYNAEQVLERTLKSVASQDYARIEHLIIDGCSTDHTLSLVQRYVEQNQARHNIRLVCEPDNGLYDAMNKALLAATGDYIVFLNAGDCLHSTDTISALAEKAGWTKGGHRHPAILYGDTHVVDDNGNFLRQRRLTPPEKLTPDSFRDGMLVCHQSFYVRTDIAKQDLYDLNYRYSADFDWCIRVIRHAIRRRIRIVNTHLVLTDYLNEGMTTRNHHASLKERFRIMVHYYGWLPTVLRHFWFILRTIIKR
ncbi:MAG: glycosyltransferase [Bacteroidaceae bacterium]|nr:glycosyltransferase [Bacteroidaceae bacterium]MBQ8454034.1 glycosyltransferase [Bacteroidaceae bacterium]